jgi:UDP-3-O-[3-hydroxymyristoyl] glucosamine N-acyltransferase
MISKRKLTLAQCAAMVQGEYEGDADLPISGVSDAVNSEDGDITFAIKNDLLQLAQQSQASAVIVPRRFPTLVKPCIRVADPVLAITLLHQYFIKKEFVAEGVHLTAVVGEDCSIPEEVTIGPYCVLGRGVTLGERVCLHPGVVLADDVALGGDCEIYPGVKVYAGSKLGCRVVIHAGTVIGSDGYGYVSNEKGDHLKRPHVGKVVIEDDVEIGANCCIDRATFGETRIRRGTKIDNLVQIGHNVEVGEDNLLVAQVGIAGSSILGNRVVLGGQTGVAGHARIGDGAMAAAKSGIHGSIPPNAIMAGYPAVGREKWLRISAVMNSLPDMHKEIRILKKEIEALQSILERKNDE